MRSSRALTSIALAALCVGVAASAATAKTPVKAAAGAQNNCPIVDAAGNVGGAGSQGQTNVSSSGVAGGVALGANALGALTLDCQNYSDGLTITAPGHTFSLTQPVKCQLACVSCKATNATTLQCSLSKSQEKVGIKAVGSWQATVNWIYARNDAAATNTKDGSCHISVHAVMTIGGKQNFAGKDLSVCAYAAGDVLQ